MSKDPGYDNTKYRTVKVSEKTIFDLHIATLQTIENQLARLHKSLESGDLSSHDANELITQLQDELCRLSESLGKAEIELCATHGKT